MTIKGSYMSDLCKECRMAPVEIKKVGLCRACYQYGVRHGTIRTRKYLRRFRPGVADQQNLPTDAGRST